MLLDDRKMGNVIRYLERAYVTGCAIVPISTRQRFREIHDTHWPLWIVCENVLDDRELLKIIDRDVTFFPRYAICGVVK